MLDAVLARMPAVSIAPGRYGRTDGSPGLVVQEIAGREIVNIAARWGRTEDVARAVQERLRLALPTVPRFAGDDRLSVAWAGAGRWLAQGGARSGLEGSGLEGSGLEGSGLEGSGLEGTLRDALDGLAAITGQGDGRAVLRVRGPAARSVLATGVPVDLHPRAFAAGHVAITAAGHIGIHLRQLDDAPVYELTAFRSFANDLCGWLIEAGRVHGAELLPPG